MSINKQLPGDSLVTIQASDDIKRLKGGSIDYNYYSSIGRDARNNEIKATSRTILGLCMKSTKMFPIVAVTIILSFVLQY
jgi:hypothetical protein